MRVASLNKILTNKLPSPCWCRREWKSQRSRPFVWCSFRRANTGESNTTTLRLHAEVDWHARRSESSRDRKLIAFGKPVVAGRVDCLAFGETIVPRGERYAFSTSKMREQSISTRERNACRAFFEQNARRRTTPPKSRVTNTAI
jgi:hypothetical protein